jgi:hypothetical protein
MTHKVIAVVNGTCPNCNNFRIAYDGLDAETKLKILVCDVNAYDKNHDPKPEDPKPPDPKPPDPKPPDPKPPDPCVAAMIGVNAFPTFKCVSKQTSIEGFGDIATVVQFVNECP